MICFVFWNFQTDPINKDRTVNAKKLTLAQNHANKYIAPSTERKLGFFSLAQLLHLYIDLSSSLLHLLSQSQNGVRLSSILSFICYFLCSFYSFLIDFCICVWRIWCILYKLLSFDLFTYVWFLGKLRKTEEKHSCKQLESFKLINICYYINVSVVLGDYPS